MPSMNNGHLKKKNKNPISINNVGTNYAKNRGEIDMTNY